MSADKTVPRQPRSKGTLLLLGLACVVVLGAALVGFFTLLPVEGQTPRVELVNEFEFGVAPMTTAFSDDTLEDVFDRQNNRFLVLEPGASRTVGVPLTFENNCTSENATYFFLRPSSELEFGDRGEASIEATLDDFELVATLGPGYCFETPGASSWVIGDPFLTPSEVNGEG